MRSDVVERLLSLNREFYQSFAADFAESRPRPQPGVQPLVAGVGRHQAVLDLGCGHGTLASALEAVGFEGRYVGIDGEYQLLARARRRPFAADAAFVQADLAAPGWSRLVAATFDWVFTLAFLHHLPGRTRRLAWAGGLARLLAARGKIVVSVWNFPSEANWRKRVVPWTAIDMDPGDLDPGDYLLDWRRGGHGLRYVHHFEPPELEELAGAAGLTIGETRYAGGDSGRLNLIQVWRRP